MFDQNGLENNRKEAVVAYLKLLVHHWPAGAETHQKTCQNSRSEGEICEPETSWIHNGNALHSNSGSIAPSFLTSR